MRPCAKVFDVLQSSRLPLIMGVVNVTPDSFYVGSRTPRPEAAIERGLRLCVEGADMLDVGGQSTRPGSEPVCEQEELRRVIPVIEGLAGQAGVAISIDTDKASVARKALKAGASILNDVSALRNDPDMAKAALGYEAVILMHRGGKNSKTMQDNPVYENVLEEVKQFLIERRNVFLRAGGEASRALFDPGIGFGKNLEHNLSLIKHLDELGALGPVALGVSRKSFLGRLAAPDQNNIPGPEERLEGSLAVACWAVMAGVKVLRVHDALATRRALQVLGAIQEAQ
ncbi:MAG: dihydropteroate synthase [Elusimicrobia bacterium RIFCSPHIGHO2_02_FULL_57_9]|nr:MAG: dihydropteroate synthase [Elusimicrobia bacterium RIFCSPHIGHO2_02_FULL_57_9]